jgi:aminomethyltransferase
MTRPKRTALYEEHLAAGGRMVEFAGFELPVQYSSLVEEHTAVRTRAGVFDVSHMGEIFVSGPGALDFIQLVSCNDHSKMTVGRAQYTGLMYPQGTFVDDTLVHKLAEDEYLLVVNAANRAKDAAYLTGLAADRADVEVRDESSGWAQLAVQGPLAQEILEPLADADLAELTYYRFTFAGICGHRAMVARTGYTGEDGFEVYCDPGVAPEIWRTILAEGGDKGLLPAGLGARDTLRFEAGMSLYGNDIDDTTTPLEANLAWIVKFKKGDYIGRDILELQKQEGLTRKLVGFEMVDRGIARHGYPVFLSENDGEAVGHCTSGTRSPTLEKALGLAYLPIDATEQGTEFFVEIRNRRAAARVVPTPFYSRKRD